MWDVSKLVVSFGILLFLSHLVVFVLLAVLYVEVKRIIKAGRKGFG